MDHKYQRFINERIDYGFSFEKKFANKGEKYLVDK